MRASFPQGGLKPLWEAALAANTAFGMAYSPAVYSLASKLPTGEFEAAVGSSLGREYSVRLAYPSSLFACEQASHRGV
ncbi:hypothetical protein A6D6_04227 [Alcanivorax xiamenensis]|uniref:Uncharacterized protein n=1 Tax=Alcanivorax xiamenensis TaxID=1177156 RepID=A0ABQ6Y249_9GAMM|nr:hypothetical protein A6D6_04227 [Alcanivorax xiamenensis]